jgi:hypothetical protein
MVKIEVSINHNKIGKIAVVNRGGGLNDFVDDARKYIIHPV